MSNTALELEPFFRAVYDAPDDLAAKLVLADLLQERSDARGEFIALQLQSGRSKRAQLRLDKLLERYRAEFLGPLAPVVKSEGQVWEHGFLVECAATLDGSTAAVPGWGTVRKLTVVGSAQALPSELTSVHLGALREVQSLDLQGLRVLSLAERPSPIQTLGIDGPGEPDDWPSHALDVVREAKTLPQLTRLGLRFWRFDPARLEWLWSAPVLPRLKLLELSMPRVPRELRSVVESLRSRAGAPDAVVLRGRTLDVKVKAEADWSHLTMRAKTPMLEVAFGDAIAMLESLPALGVTRLDVTSEFKVSAAGLARMKRTVKRFTRLEWVSWPD